MTYQEKWGWSKNNDRWKRLRGQTERKDRKTREIPSLLDIITNHEVG